MSHLVTSYLVGDLRAELPGLLELRQFGADVERRKVARRGGRTAVAVVVLVRADLREYIYWGIKASWFNWNKLKCLCTEVLESTHHVELHGVVEDRGHFDDLSHRVPVSL